MENKKPIVEKDFRSTKEISNGQNLNSISRIEESLRIEKQKVEDGKFYIKNILEEDADPEDNARI